MAVGHVRRFGDEHADGVVKSSSGLGFELRVLLDGELRELRVDAVASDESRDAPLVVVAREDAPRPVPEHRFVGLIGAEQEDPRAGPCQVACGGASDESLSDDGTIE